MLYFETNIGAVAALDAYVQAIAETENGFTVFGSDGKVWEAKAEPQREVVTHIEGAEVWMAYRNPHTGRMAWTRAPLTQLTQREGAITGTPVEEPLVHAPVMWADQQHNVYALVDNLRGSWARVEYINGYPLSAVAEIASLTSDRVFRITLVNGAEEVVSSEPYMVEVRPAGADFELWLVSGDASAEGEDLKVDWQCFPVESIELSVPVFTRQMADIKGINPTAGMQPEPGSGEQVLVDLKRKRATHLGSGDPLEWSRDLAQVLRQAARRYTREGCVFTMPEWLADGGEVECASWSGMPVAKAG